MLLIPQSKMNYEKLNVLNGLGYSCNFEKQTRFGDHNSVCVPSLSPSVQNCNGPMACTINQFQSLNSATSRSMLLYVHRNRKVYSGRGPARTSTSSFTQFLSSGTLPPPPTPFPPPPPPFRQHRKEIFPKTGL